MQWAFGLKGVNLKLLMRKGFNIIFWEPLYESNEANNPYGWNMNVKKGMRV